MSGRIPLRHPIPAGGTLTSLSAPTCYPSKAGRRGPSGHGVSGSRRPGLGWSANRDRPSGAERDPTGTYCVALIWRLLAPLLPRREPDNECPHDVHDQPRVLAGRLRCMVGVTHLTPVGSDPVHGLLDGIDEGCVVCA